VEIVILRRGLVMALLAMLGVAVVVLPTVAGSEVSPTIKAVNTPGSGYYGESHAWSPSQATVSAGGVVTLSNPTAVEHGVQWVSGPETPSCSAGIPVGATAAARGANWSGTCVFAKAGVYSFYCTVHGPEMTGTITVNPSGTVTTTTTQPPSQGGGSTTITTNGSGPTAGSAGSPLAGSAGSAIKLGGNQRGKAVHGSVKVSQAGAGGRLEVDLLTRSASLASSPHSTQVEVGRVVHSSLAAGTVPFTVPLNAKAKRALRARRHLALTVRIVLSATGGSALTITRSVLLRV
jgi:plastocyanin